MKQWIVKWFKQLVGQSFFYTAPIAILTFSGAVFAYFLPEQYAMPLTAIMFIVIGYFLFDTQNGFKSLTDCGYQISVDEYRLAIALLSPLRPQISH